MAILEVDDLSVHHKTTKGTVYAVAGVTFDVSHGETLGLVGESGCGKSTLARAIVGLDKITSGRVEVGGTAVGTDTRHRKVQGRMVQMVFQDPFGSLNPRLTVLQLVTEPLDVHKVGTKTKNREQAIELLSRVGIPLELHERLPHQLSGGQRQRVSIARALGLAPKLLVCDEPVSALDVSVQAQVLNLLVRLQSELGLSILFISHDLSVIRYISHRIAVMYLGKIVEIGPVESVWNGRLHPYTRALIAAAPVEIESEGTTVSLQGDIPSPLSPPSGCRFRTRCLHTIDLCAQEDPALKEYGQGHMAACHRIDEISAAREVRNGVHA